MTRTELRKIMREARAAVDTFRDAAHAGRRIGYRERDKLVMAIHKALDLLWPEK